MFAMYRAEHRPVQATYRRRSWWKFWKPKVLVPGSIKLGLVRAAFVGLFPDKESAFDAGDRLGLVGFYLDEVPDDHPATLRLTGQVDSHESLCNA